MWVTRKPPPPGPHAKAAACLHRHSQPAQGGLRRAARPAAGSPAPPGPACQPRAERTGWHPR
eukprot:1883551-Lingulodinium_polyedra.AAC.1